MFTQQHWFFKNKCQHPTLGQLKTSVLHDNADNQTKWTSQDEYVEAHPYIYVSF